MAKERTKRKGKPVSVRFDAEFVEKLKKERGIKTPQQAVDFFQKWYEQTFHPIAGNPVMERNYEPFIHPPQEPYPGTISAGQKNVSRETVGKLTRRDFAKIDEAGQFPMPPDPEKKFPLPDEIIKRISQLEQEIAHPPAKFTSDLSKKLYFHDRNKELKQLKGEK